MKPATKPIPALVKHAETINKTVNDTVTTVARAKIAIGRNLLKAKEYFDDSKSFTTWREEHTLIQSKQEASYCMQVAEKFGDAPSLIENVSFGVMRELVTAPIEVIKEVEKLAEKGDSPTVQETRSLVRESKDGQTQRPVSGSGGESTGGRPAPMPTHHQRPDIGKVISMRFDSRHDWVSKNRKSIDPNPYSWAFVLYGLDPDPAVMPNPMVITILKHEYREMCGTYNRDFEIIQEAFDEIEVAIAQDYSS